MDVQEECVFAGGEIMGSFEFDLMARSREGIDALPLRDFARIGGRKTAGSLLQIAFSPGSLSSGVVFDHQRHLTNNGNFLSFGQIQQFGRHLFF